MPTFSKACIVKHFVNVSEVDGSDSWSGACPASQDTLCCPLLTLGCCWSLGVGLFVALPWCTWWNKWGRNGIWVFILPGKLYFYLLFSLLRRHPFLLTAFQGYHWTVWDVTLPSLCRHSALCIAWPLQHDTGLLLACYLQWIMNCPSQGTRTPD